MRSQSLWSLDSSLIGKVDPDLKSKIEIVTTEFSLNDFVVNTYDLIELSWGDFKQLTPLLQRAETMVQKLGWSDAAVSIAGEIKPLMLHERVLAEMLSMHKVSIQRNFIASVVGDLSTLASFTNVIQKLGYSFIRFFCSPKDRLEAEKLSAKLCRMFVNLKIEIHNFEDITEIDGLSSLIIVDIDLVAHKELFEILSYFNFMSPNSIFLDLREIHFEQLRQEAEKAELTCLSGKKFWVTRYNLAMRIQHQNNKP